MSAAKCKGRQPGRGALSLAAFASIRDRSAAWARRSPTTATPRRRLGD